jgi:hypothetical protein
VPKEHFISFKSNGCQGLPFRKGRQALKKERKKIKAGFKTKQAFSVLNREERKEKRDHKAGFFLKGKKERKERKKKKKDAWVPALVVPWGECPPDPPFNPPAKNPHPPPSESKERKEKKTPAFVNRNRH